MSQSLNTRQKAKEGGQRIRSFILAIEVILFIKKRDTIYVSSALALPLDVTW